MLWLQLRERRYSLPKHSALLQGSSSRVGTLAAAMQQFEEQMTAAKAVTSATRPLNLYYGLVQAGARHNCSSSAGPVHFQPPRAGPRRHEARPPRNRCVEPKEKERFSESRRRPGPKPDGPVSIDTLWESLPDLCEKAPLRNSQHLSALYIIPEAGPFNVQSVTINGIKVPTPEPPSPPMRATVYFTTQPSDAPDGRPWVTDQLSHYPSVGNWQQPDDETSDFELLTFDRSKVTIEWPNPKPGSTLSEEERDAFFDGIAPNTATELIGICVPRSRSPRRGLRRR